MTAAPPPPSANAPFSLLDWGVLALYFALLVGTGVWLSRRQKGTEDYFLASRRMPAWAVAISVLATSLSAATFLGAPQQSFDENIAYLFTNVGVVIASVIVALFFIPVYYRLGVTTVYELLERRFGPGAKKAGSLAFMVGRIFASGARIYIAAHAISFAAFGDFDPAHLLIAVAVLTGAGILYTVAGGIETVIWTDVVQTVVFLVAVAVAIGILLAKIPASGSEIVHALAQPGPAGPTGKLTLIDPSLDFSRPMTVWTTITGIMLLNLAALGADHDLAQRLLTCRSPVKGSLSVVASTFISIPVVAMFLCIGLLLHVYYSRPDLMGAAAPAALPEGRKAFLSFITTEMPPGMAGLMIAGLFAVGLGSLDSALNAMSATFVNDLYKPRRPGRDERHYLRVARAGVVIWGVILGLFAMVCVWWQHSRQETFINFALQVMTFAYSGLLAVFLGAIFTRRGTSASAISALIVGFLVVLVLQADVFKWWTGSLPFTAPTPEIVDDWRLGELRLAWPWAMVLATGAAFMVCILPRGRAHAV